MDENHNWKFKPNSKYFTIGIYTIIVVIFCACFIKLIAAWSTTLSFLGGFLKTISPFLIGLFIAFIINPLVKWIDKFIFTKLLHIKHVRAKNYLSILVSYTLIIGIIVVSFVFLIPQIVRSLNELANVISDIAPRTVDLINNLEKKFPSINLESVNKMIENSLPNITSFLQNSVSTIIGSLYGIGRSIISWTLNIIIAFMVSCYMILDKKHLYLNMKRLLYAYIPTAPAKHIAKTLRECSSIFTGFVVGKTIDSLIIGLLCFIIMTFFNLNYTLLISIIVGITNMIPYFGPFIGAVPGAFILVMISPKQALIFIILIIILQQFDGLYLGPKILGGSTGLRPLWIIFAITLGGWVAGPVGMFLGVPFIAVISFLVENHVSRKLARRGLDIPLNPNEKLGAGTDLASELIITTDSSKNEDEHSEN